MTIKQSTEDQKLTSIVRELLVCAKAKKSILLYGKDSVKRKDLVLRVHEENWGVANELEPYSQRKYVDCGTLNGREVYKKLVGTKIVGYEGFDVFGNFGTSQCEEDTYKGFLFECKGTLFVDSLHCDSKDENNTYYRKLAGIIKKGITVNWLVAYTYDLKSLPSYFREQFEEINLEPEKQDKDADTPPSIEKEKEKAQSVTYHHIKNFFQGNIDRSQIQIETAASTQNHSNVEINVPQLREVVKALKSSLGKLPLDNNAQAELLAETQTLESQSNSPKPNDSILRKSLGSVHRILEGAAGNLVASGLLTQIGGLFVP